MPYAEFFIPSKGKQPMQQAVGAVILGVAPASQMRVTKVAPSVNLSQLAPPSPVSSVASKVMDLGPVGIIGVVAVAAVAGYVVVKAVSKKR